MDHIYYMQQALKLAQKAYKKDEVPIGALVVNSAGIIIGRGYNLVEHTKQQTSHAEIRAISQACRKIKDWRLDGCWIYVTLEPCAMCINLILLSRISGLVFGAPSPIFGYKLDKTAPIQLYRRNKLTVINGVCAEEATVLLKKFFKEKRNSRERGKKTE